MRFSRKRIAILAAVVAILVGAYFFQSARNHARSPGVPKVWDDAELADLMLPLARAEFSPRLASSTYYYWIPIRTLYKTYPVYHPDREPAGYLDWLREQEPQEFWSSLELESKQDWIDAGKLVFEAPLYGGGLAPTSEEYRDSLYVREENWLESVKAPVAGDGLLPFYRYVVEKRGVIRVGILSCAMCHTRVLEDGTVAHGAQGNLPFDRAFAYDYRFGEGRPEDQIGLERLLYHAPWHEFGKTPSTTEAIAVLHDAIPPGVMARHGASPIDPVTIPDLYHLADRRYLDRTGLIRNRGIADIMRYAALNQGADDHSTYGKFSPLADAVGFSLPPFLAPPRYSDDQLHALALYLDSLTAPPSPHPFDEVARRGKEVFEAEGCARCHTPPLYTSNKLTPVEGFEVPPDHRDKYAIEEESLATDPGLALNTRRGTGYYKVPSLRHVWMRGPLAHDGSCATLEDWFDPRRLETDYKATGFQRREPRTAGVPGHEYGLDLSEDDRRALIAFLRTL